MRRIASQYAKRVKVLKYVKVGDGWRFANVVERNGKTVRDHVLISGCDQHHREGTYYLEWYEVGNRRRRKAVRDFAELIEQARRKAIEVEAMRAGLISVAAKPTNAVSERLRVSTAIDKYLDFIEHHRSHRTYLTYRYTLSTLLRDSLGTVALEEVSRDDILKFMTDCYKLGLGNRTVYDKLVVALQMFKRFGKAKLIDPSDWPDYVEKIRPIYSPEDIRAMLKHAEDDEGIFLKFLLGSGFRDQEIQYVTWRDLDCPNSLVQVTAKPLSNGARRCRRN